MKKCLVIAMGFILVVSFVSIGLAKDYKGKKVLFVDSYHEGYAWSDGITQGIQKTLAGTGVDLEIIRMDTKRNKDDAFKKTAAKEAKAAIEVFKPDVIIAADDNASKFLIMPYFKNVDVPVVFCGVNWDATVYGYPYQNATGMVEVTPIPQILEQLRPFAKGDRIGMIGPDIITAHKEADNYRKVFGYELTEYYATDFEDWKKGFAELQDQVDMLIVDSDGGLYSDHTDEMKAFVEANTKIPTGAAYDFMASYALMTYGKLAQEQGAWSASTALKILDGDSPADIPLIKNKEGTLIINVRIAKNMGAEIPFEILESADKIIE
ncbi:MAG: hypothetical protein K9M96_16060 [Deltaproteobacteria bacterium]|nr:hypothetical protein [Deltaproteobacteria bacterium]